MPSLSIFENDGTLGRRLINDQPPFQCFAGDPYLGSDGEWHCPDVSDTGGVKPLPGTRPPLYWPPVIYVNEPTKTTPIKVTPTASVAADDGTIFGLPKVLVYIAAGGAALYFMSTMTDAKEGKK